MRKLLLQVVLKKLLSIQVCLLSLILLLMPGISVHAQNDGTGKKIGTLESIRTLISGLNIAGNGISITLPSGDTALSVSINYKKTVNGEEVIIGKINGSELSNIFFNISASSLEGKAVLMKEKKAIKFYSDAGGNVFAANEDIHDVVCVEYQKAPAENTDGLPVLALPAPGSTAYTLQSLPGAAAVAFLDFNGQYVSGTRWNSGNPINAQPSTFSEAQITEMWKMISEDYRPFNINITTDSTIFFKAAANRRIRCIFTPTNTAAPGAGGVAYVNSFSSGNDNDTPCWVFNSSTKSAGEAGAHELGHTFGLSHDGTSTDEYYTGHGYWAPIMGAGYYDILVQWSKGEYPDANNQEDDLAIITKSANGVTYRTDEAGSTTATAKALTIGASGTVAAADNYGIITQTSDIDFYSFKTSGGPVTITVNPSPLHPDLNVLLKLMDASGTVLVTADPVPASTATNTTRTADLAATISTTLAAGTYYISIDGTGEGDLTTGYSDYASLGEYTISGTVPVSPGSQLPVVTITAPATNTVFTAPATITLTATASDPDGTVSKVDFYNGTALIGTSTTSPYTYSWTNVAAGTYTITAKATDNNGNTGTSAAITIIVNAPPAVAITAPATNATYTAPASITINATATDADGTITKVDFYNGTTLLGTDNTSSYSYSWTNVAAGTYTITAVATDNRGVTTTSTAVIVVVKTNTPPTVTITAPANNTILTAPASVTLTATATDADGTVSKVEFYNGTTLLTSDATSPYSYSWTNVAAGTYTITAVATDNLGLKTTSAAITIIVNTLPAVTITAPANNATFISPATITINATASDADGTISKVDFYNGTTLIASDNTAPYSADWTNVAAGTYTITAIATDNRGATTTSTGIKVVVNTNAAPVVTTTAPANNATFTAPAAITLTATATDADGTISKVEFFNGTTSLGSDATSPYSFTWNNVPAGTYTVTARATDNLGLTATSAAITVIVKDNTAPLVSITAPANNTVFTAPANISLSATATDADGTISKVEFFNGTTSLGSDATSPYSFAWNNVPAGTYSITAVATDNLGLTKTSEVITVVVKENTAPVIVITAPANNTVFKAPGAITLTADATDADGTITQVEFFNGTTSLGSDVSAPYSFAWNNVPAGTYTVTAVATDNLGQKTTSLAITIIVNTPPLVNITAPSNNTVYSAPATVTITATATDADGTISKVNFYNGAVLLYSDNSAPYSYAWTNVAAGTFTLTAVATDNQGATTTSTLITVTVKANEKPSISITDPVNNANYAAPANINLTATATDADGTIEAVDFYYGSQLLGTATGKAPYTVSWGNIPAGTYEITAIAVDDKGATTTSAPVTIIVSDPIINGVTLQKESVDLSAFPNPFTNNITIGLKNGERLVSVKLFDVNGKEILTMPAENADQIILGEDLPAGIYMLIAISETQSIIKRIVKTR